MCVSGKRLNAYGVLYDPSNPTTPLAPSNLTAAQTAWDTVNLNWADHSNNEVGFEVQRYRANKPVFMRHQSTAQNVHTCQDHWARTYIGGVTYTYRVRAGNLGGMSGFTNTAIVNISYSAPAAPSALNAETNMIPNIVLTWDDNSNNELTFIIERKRQGSNWSQVGVTSSNTTTYIDHVTLTGTYYYRMKAQNPVGNSSYSNQITVVVESL